VARQRARAGERDRARRDPHAGRRGLAQRPPERITARKVEPLVAERTPGLADAGGDRAARTCLWVLQNEGGNKSRAAEVLGIDRRRCTASSRATASSPDATRVTPCDGTSRAGASRPRPDSFAHVPRAEAAPLHDALASCTASCRTRDPGTPATGRA
jgi:hypothetical protein